MPKNTKVGSTTKDSKLLNENRITNWVGDNNKIGKAKFEVNFKAKLFKTKNKISSNPAKPSLFGKPSFQPWF